MACANIKGSEFIKLAKDNNLSISTLENITHQYWIEKNSSEDYPTSTYIQAQLGNVPYKEEHKIVRDFWKKYYSKPQIFNTLEEVNEAYNEAKKYFPESVIVKYADNRERYVLTVKKPVQEIKSNRDSFFTNSRNANPEHFGKSLKGNERATVLQISESNKNQFLFMEEADIKAAIINALNNSTLPRETVNSITEAVKGMKKNKILSELNTMEREQEDFENIINGLVKSGENVNFVKEKKPATNPIIPEAVTKSIETGEWTEQSINEFNDIINKVKDGRIHFQRTVGERRSFAEGISEIHAGASLLIGGHYGTSKAQPGKAAEEFQEDAKQGKEQERIIEAWAKANDLWLNDYTDEEGNKADSLEDLLNSQWPYFAQGSEAVVHTYDENTVLKAINLAHTNDNVAKLLDKLALFNQQFPETALNVVGFGRDAMGHFRVIVLQDFIQGEELSEDELKDFIDKYQATPEGNYKTEDNNIIISDLGTYNILKDKNGVYHVIDADVVYNTPAMGGNVRFSNTLTENTGRTTNLSDRTQFAISGKHGYTFKDGISVETPFELNDEQKDALEAMDKFIHSSELTMTLSGYAGTGKTSLMEMLAQKMVKEGRPIEFCASTNRAARVLRKRVQSAGFNARTLHKVFGINVEVDSTQEYDADNVINTLKDANVSPYSTIVIDEASMIGTEHYKIINEVAKKYHLKIIYVGDKKQLPPVGEDQLSMVFRDPSKKVAELKKVMRTDDNAILREATDLRNGKKLSGRSSFNKDGKGVAYIKRQNKTALNNIIRQMVPGLAKDPDFFRILAHTRAKVADYNREVRESLGYNDYIPRVGEPMMGYFNWGPEESADGWKFVNSEAYKVVDVKPSETKSVYLEDGTVITVDVVPIVLEDSLGEIREFKYLDIKGNAANRDKAIKLADEKARLINARNFLPKTSPRRKLLNGIIRSIEDVLFVNDDLLVPRKDNPNKKKPLQKKVIDFGYAMTIHKSQGSTITHVIVDDTNIEAQEIRNNNRKSLNNLKNATDVALDFGMEGSMPQDMSGFEMTSSQDVDIFGNLDATLLESMPEETPEESDEVNEGQQLRYVAVSRATDTVTILSNHVETEDSPLNHIKNLTPKAPDNTTSQAPKGNNDINKQQPTQVQSQDETWTKAAARQEFPGTRTITYTPVGKTEQTYYVRDGHIYNKENKEVFAGDNRDRNKILANLALQEGRAVIVVNRQGKRYVVLNDQTIINIDAQENGKIMNWDEKSGDRKEILEKAETAFEELLQAPARSLNTLRNIYQFGRDHIDFIEGPHEYYVDGTLAVSATQYTERIFGKKNIDSSLYRHSAEIGNTVDRLCREYFDSHFNVEDRFYPNLNDERKQQIINDLKRFESYLDQRFGVVNGVKQYKVITSEDLKIAAQMQGGELIAGTMDMIVIDVKGNIHIFDFKAKSHPITKTYRGKEVSDRRDYTAQLNLYRAILETNPNLKGRVKSLQLLWFDTAYPSINNATYTTHDGKHFLIKENAASGEAVPIEDYKGFKTPSLKSNVADSVIQLAITDKLDITNEMPNEKIPTMSAITPGTKPTAQTAEVTEQQLWDSPEVRVQQSKLLNKDAIIDVLVGNQEGIEIAYQINNCPNMMGLIHYNEKKNRWTVNPQPKEGIKYEDLNSLEKDIYDHTPEYFTLENQQKAVDHFIPKDLQEYFTSGEYERSDAAANEFFDTLTKENPKLSVEERVAIFNNTERGKGIGSNVLRDRWGIYTFNVTTNEVNLLKPTTTKQQPASQAKQPTTQVQPYARTSSNGYEVSSKGDSRFSALNARFAPGTIIFGHDVSGRTIESVYQHGMKQDDWTTNNNYKTGVPKSGIINSWPAYFEGGGRHITEDFAAVPDDLVMKMADNHLGDGVLTKDDLEDISYYMGYLPLWQEWAKQNPALMDELRQKSEGKTLTDQFASSRVSQARALAEILGRVPNSKIQPTQQVQSENNQLHVEQKDELKRYTYKETSDINAFNTVAAALRDAGWHVEFYNKKQRNGANTNEVMTISLEGKPEKGFFELVKDIEDNAYSIHFKTKSARALNNTPYASEALTDAEKDAMFEALAWAVPEQGVVSTWGTISKGGKSGLNRLSDLGFIKHEERTVEDEDGNPVNIPVYTKNSNSVLTQQVLEQMHTVAEIPIEFSKGMDKFFKERKNNDLIQRFEEQREMEAIKAKAQADGTFMKAPNGKDTNLTERQWLQVRTKAFKEWFGDWEKEYTPQTNPYKENPWERYIHTEKTGTYISNSGRELPLYANRGIRYAHPVERKTPTKDDPFGFNSFRINKLIYVGEEINEANTLDGICQSTANACKEFLKNRYNIDSSIFIIQANSPVKDARIDHWVNVVYIDHVAYIYDMPQTEYIKRTKPFTKNGYTYYEGVVTNEFKPRLIKVTKENLEKYYGYGETDSQRALITDDRFNQSISLDNITYIPAYSKDVSKVVDENGEPLVVYHGSREANKIRIFNKNEWSKTKLTDEEIKSIQESKDKKDEILWAEEAFSSIMKDPIISLLIETQPNYATGEYGYRFKTDAHKTMSPKELEELKERFGNKEFIDEYLSEEGPNSKDFLNTFYSSKESKDSGEYAESALKMSSLGQTIKYIFSLLEEKSLVWESINADIERELIHKDDNIQTLNGGIWFTPYPEYAEYITGTTDKIAVFLNIRNLQEPETGLNSAVASRYFALHPEADGIYGRDSGNRGDIAYAVKDSNQIKSATDNVGTFSTENDDIQAAMIGVKGARNLDAAEEATTRMDNLSIANDMEKAGKDALTIKMATGWERGADGKWRYEIPDIEFKKNSKGEEKIYEGFYRVRGFIIDGQNMQTMQYLSKVVDYSMLPTIYQELLDEAEIKIVYNPDSDEKGSYEVNSYNNPIFTLNIGSTDESPKEILVHEIQHFIQDREGFSQGGNPSMARDAYLKQKGIYDVYYKLQKNENGYYRTLQKIVANDPKSREYEYIARRVDQATDMLPTDESITEEEVIKWIKAWVPEWKEGVNYDDLAYQRRQELIKEHAEELKEAEKRDEKTYKELEALDSTIPNSYEAYRRLAGEAEARTASKRINLSAKERRNSLFTDDMYKDVAKEDLIFLQENAGTAASMRDKDIFDYNNFKADNPNLQFYETPEGTVYGFHDPKTNTLYFDENIIRLDHAFHEYTHMWDTAVYKKNKALWNKGVSLMKVLDGGKLWNEVLNDRNYGQKWLEQGLKGDELDFQIGSEVHSRLVGEKGAQRLEEIASKKGNKNIVQKLKEWMLEVWKDLKKTFSKWEDKDIEALTLDQFNEMTLRDFADGVKIRDIAMAPELMQQGTQETTARGSQAAPEAKGTPEGTSSEEENTPRKVTMSKLYQDLVNDTSDIEVDADWKVDELESLDGDLVAASADEEINEILDNIKKVIEAKSEEEYRKQPSRREQEVKKNLDNYERVINQINNLLDAEDIEGTGVGMSATEVRHTAELVVNAVSDAISDLQSGKVDVKEMFPSLKIEKELKGADRKDIVKAVGIQNLIERAKQKFDPETNDNESIDWTDELIIQADLVVNNWDAFIIMASDIFAATEGFGFRMDYSKGKFTETEGTNIDYDNFDKSQDPDGIREEEDEQEHWQVETRTIDILNSMSDLVRMALHDCYIMERAVDPQGNYTERIKQSKWGIAERVNPRTAVNSILRWVQGASTLEEMVEKLKEKQNQHLWLKQLIQRLEDGSGKETNLQSQFYSVFTKHYQLYSIVKNENGKYYCMDCNRETTLFDAIQNINAQIKMEQHPLFTDKGVSTKYLGTKTTTGKEHEFNLHQALTALSTITSHLDRKQELSPEQIEEAQNNIMGVCRVLGFLVADTIVEEAFNYDMLRECTYKLAAIVSVLDKVVERQKEEPAFIKTYDPLGHYSEMNVRSAVSNFLKPMAEVLEDTGVTAFYDSGKMYQSYTIPSWLTKRMKQFALKGQALQDFLDENYANSEWFFKDGQWRNEMLYELSRGAESNDIFEHKVELNFNKKNYMKNMNDSEYILSLITNYRTVKSDEDRVPAWFRVPIQSNKPSCDYIKFWSYRGMDYKDEIIGNNGSSISSRQTGMFGIYCQELSRIQTVRMRGLSKKDPNYIKNWDENGKKFCFLPFLNNYLENSEANKARRNAILDADGKVSEENATLARLLQRKVEGLEEEKLNPAEEAQLVELVQKAIRGDMERHVQQVLDRWEENGIFEAALKIENIGIENLKTDEEKKAAVRATLENFLWNDRYAAMNILQLTVGDIAFYKDAEDLQKRLSELHAPGLRGFKEVIAYDEEGNSTGERVSDGYYRTFILKDFDSFISNVIENITTVLDRKIARAPEKEKAQWEALKYDLVRPRTYNEDGSVKDRGGKYWNINATDAQGFSSPTSYRKKAYIFGKWSREAEGIYRALLKGDYKYSNLETAFQPLKPFVYTHLKKDLGVPNAPITTMNVAFQAKNAEYLLIMADAMIRGEEKVSGKINKPNLLRAIYNIMEDSAYDGRERNDKGEITKEGTYNGRGIDTVQFESAIKSGLQGVIDIQAYESDPNGEARAYKLMKESIYKEEYDREGNRLFNNYNEATFVHTTSFDDYCMQQEVPEHFRDHEQGHGSQVRMITPSDLDYFYDENKDPNDPNNIVWYEFTDPNAPGKVKRLRADDFKTEYEETIAKNIEQSIADLQAELSLDHTLSRRDRNLALSKILQKEILSSPRYGIDLIQACSIDKETGEFRIPKGDPVQAKRIEQLVNSIIKNRINKQKIAGGPIVQVSSFGVSNTLHIRFKDKEGNLLKTKEEFIKNLPYETEEDKAKADAAYDTYKDENQAGIAYFEVYLPIWSKDIYNKFCNEDGTIDVETIEALDPDLLKMISYRIPTEDKYSCAPMKAVGFMPREAGDAIMLPQELTEIDDSDFDVDKRYVMRKDIDIKTRRKSEIRKELVDAMAGNVHFYQAWAVDTSADKEKKVYDFIKNKVYDFLENPEENRFKNPLNKILWNEYKKIAYYTDHPTSGKRYNDNKIVDMTWSVLTHEMTADKILNPGGFEGPKKTAYVIAALKNPANAGMTFEELEKMDTEDLKKLSYVDKDLTWADTQVQFYHQNVAGSNLIGVMAVNKVAHATLEGDNMLMDVSTITGSDEFTIAGFKFGGKGRKFKNRKTLEEIDLYDGLMVLDPTTDAEGSYIGKVLGSLVSASADTAKDPILDLINVNMTTASFMTTLIRLGMPFKKAALFLSQDVITKVLRDFSKQNLTKFKSLDDIINEWISKYRDELTDIDVENQGEEDELPIPEGGSSQIQVEELTEKELINGLSEGEHKETDYKVLLALQKVKALSEAVRKPTFATRFNSISSAVGPLIIDNLILEHKMEGFMPKDSAAPLFYSLDGAPMFLNDVFENHPVLESFSKAVGIAKDLFLDMPAGSNSFRALLSTLKNYSNVVEKVFSDKKLLSDLSDFYQSYMLVEAGLIDPKELEFYIEDFPKEFLEKDEDGKTYKELYPDNALIQAIDVNINKKSGRAFLKIKITGVDEQVKENMRAGWVDLHKKNPSLSKDLFKYCFFRAGIGFNPKAFMSLVPGYVKERLSTKLPNGKEITYVDVYRHNSDKTIGEELYSKINYGNIIDQFIMNNWNDSRLVPLVEDEEVLKKAQYDRATPIIILKDSDLVDSFDGIRFFKTKKNKETHLWKLSHEGKNEKYYIKVDPLGNNGEYVVISKDSLESDPITKTTTTDNVEDAPSPYTQVDMNQSQQEEEKKIVIENPGKEVKDLAEFATLMMRQMGTTDENKAWKKINEIRTDPHQSKWGKFLQNVFTQKGLTYDKNKAIEIFNKLC